MSYLLVSNRHLIIFFQLSSLAVIRDCGATFESFSKKENESTSVVYKHINKQKKLLFVEELLSLDFEE